MLAAAPALADQRSYSVTSFSRIRVEGPVTVRIERSTAPGAYAEGDRHAIDRIRVESGGDLLMIGIDRTNWTGTEPTPGGRAVLHVRAPRFQSLSVIGAGDVSVEDAAGTGAGFTLTLTGAGRAAITGLDIDQLVVGINGAGAAKLAGRAKQARIRSQGEGQIDGTAITVQDADISLIGAGDIRLRADRTARNMLKGSGRIVIDGDAACSGSSEGSGEVHCGAQP